MSFRVYTEASDMELVTTKRAYQRKPYAAVRLRGRNCIRKGGAKLTDTASEEAERIFNGEHFYPS